ncbi:MAG: hypothetical protein R3282_10770, partial [Rhodothermales bacterium]|nr:hypothetical protein [Rhodothermales bacterium]
PCDDLSSADRTATEIEIHVMDVGLCGNNISCVDHFHPIGFSTLTSEGRHQKYANIYLDTQNIDGGSFEYHQTINHEFGHVLGLADPATNGSECNGEQVNPPSSIPVWDSVMHQFSAYGCSGSDVREFPTSTDKSSASAINQDDNHD